jgi:hypothetical protein
MKPTYTFNLYLTTWFAPARSVYFRYGLFFFVVASVFDREMDDTMNVHALIVDHEPVAPDVIGSVSSFLESDFHIVTIDEIYLRIVLVHPFSDFSGRNVLSFYRF